MQLDNRAGECCQGIVQGPGVMGECTGVDDDAIASIPCLLDLINQFTLVIALVGRGFKTQSLCFERCCHHVVSERRRAVDLGLALTEQVQVRPMQNQDPAGNSVAHAVTVALSPCPETLQRPSDRCLVDPRHHVESIGTVDDEGEAIDNLLVPPHQFNQRAGIDAVG